MAFVFSSVLTLRCYTCEGDDHCKMETDCPPSAQYCQTKINGTQDSFCCIYLIFSHVHIMDKPYYLLQWQRDSSIIAYCFWFFQQVTKFLELVRNSVPKTIPQTAAKATFAEPESSLSVHFHFLINENSKWESNYLNLNLTEDDLLDYTILMWFSCLWFILL